METDAQPIAQPKQLTTIETDRQYRVIRFSPNAKTLYGAGFDAAIHRWDLSGELPTELLVLPGHHGWVESLIFAAKHNLLLSTDSWGQLCAWDIAPENPRPRWRHAEAHDGWIRAASISEDQTLIATAGRDGTVRVWSVTDGKLLHELPGHEHEIFSVAVHKSGQAAASADLLGNLKHWELPSGKCVREVRLESMHYHDRDHDVAGLYSLRFHDAGKTLLCAGSQPNLTGNVGGIPSICWLDWESLEVTKTMEFGEKKQGYVYDYQFHPDGYLMLVTSGAPGAGQFICQRLDEEQPFFTTTKMSNCHSLAFDAASNRCIVAATNRNSQGNGAVRDKEGKYLGNTSPLTIFELPAMVDA